MKITTKILSSGIGVVAAFALSVSSTQANLLVDPGFESGAPGQVNPIPLPGGAGGGWAVFNGAAFSTAAAETGTYGIIESQGIGQAWNFQAPYQVVGGVSAGQLFSLSADFMTPTGITQASPFDPVIIQMTFFDAAGTDIGTVETGGVGANAVAYTPAAANIWYTATVSATAPAGAAYVAPYLAFMENGSQTGADTLYWDNAVMNLVPEPSSLAFLAMGLGIGFSFLRRKSL